MCSHQLLKVSRIENYLNPRHNYIFFSTATCVIFLKKVPITKITTITRFIRKNLSSGSPVSHTDWEKGHLIEINSLGECNHDFKYLVIILSDKEIPYYDRQKKALIILKQQLDSKILLSLVCFLTCILSILVLFTLFREFMTMNFPIEKVLH